MFSGEASGLCDGGNDELLDARGSLLVYVPLDTYAYARPACPLHSRAVRLAVACLRGSPEAPLGAARLRALAMLT